MTAAGEDYLRGYALPPCLTQEIGSACFDALGANPQPYDIGMDAIVTENGAQHMREGADI